VQTPASARNALLGEANDDHREMSSFAIGPTYVSECSEMPALVVPLRFSYAFDMLSAHPNGDLSTIAAQAGFSDQSHMTREFQTSCGATPSVLRKARFDDLAGIPAAVLLNR
jgi:AraC-like DNA-binding protein